MNTRHIQQRISLAISLLILFVFAFACVRALFNVMHPKNIEETTCALAYPDSPYYREYCIDYKGR